MAYNYDGRQYQHRQPADNIHLKPMFNADAASLNSRLSDEYYRPVASHPVPDAELLRLEANDQRLKHRIRVLKLVSRTVAAIMSAVTLAPLVMTLVKFFETRNTYYSVGGQERTAWANGTITWYTYMYAAVSAVSFILSSAIVVAYWRGVKQANTADKINSYWSNIILASHITVWAVSAGIYRYGKEPVDGKFKDLWGWTCSTAAAELQAVITDVQYNRYCNIQSASFYSGLVNVGTGILSASIYVFAILRVRSKKRVQKASFRMDEATEPLRS